MILQSKWLETSKMLLLHTFVSTPLENTRIIIDLLSLPVIEEYCLVLYTDFRIE